MLIKKPETVVKAWLFGAVLSVLFTMLVVPQEARAQGFQGSEPGNVGQFRVPPQNRIFNQGQEQICVRFNEIERTSSRTCLYRCSGGQVFERTLPRTRFCDPSVDLTTGQINREVSGAAPTQCRLKRLRLTRADKLCIYDCGGDVVNLSIPISRTCDRNYTQ